MEIAGNFCGNYRVTATMEISPRAIGDPTHTSELCGTLLNLNPSKFIAAKRTILAYSTVFICDVADYETVERGIAYVQNAENAAVPCTGRVVHYKGDVPSGASKSQEWGNARKGI